VEASDLKNEDEDALIAGSYSRVDMVADEGYIY
jgi:hypothetical protein